MTEDELTRVRLPLLTALKDSLRSNAYWIGNVLARAQEKPEMLDWARNRIADINSITTADIAALARQYLGRDHVSRVTILPRCKPESRTRGKVNRIECGFPDLRFQQAERIEALGAIGGNGTLQRSGVGELVDMRAHHVHADGAVGFFGCKIKLDPRVVIDRDGLFGSLLCLHAV